MKKVLKGCLTISVAFSAVMLLACGYVIYTFIRPAKVYETNSVADYGNIVGNYDNETPREYIFSFFPATISDSFSDVTYHYKAKKFDTYAYEAYLEFVIEDEEVFSEFIKPYVDDSAPFVYDDSFMENSIDYQLSLQYDGDTVTTIGMATIGKILYSMEEQRIIYFALGMWDGGGTYVSELSYFVDRFGIDWKDFEARSDPSPTITLFLD